MVWLLSQNKQVTNKHVFHCVHKTKNNYSQLGEYCWKGDKNYEYFRNYHMLQHITYHVVLYINQSQGTLISK